MDRAKISQEIGALIDHIEQIRDELLSIQRSMEKMEVAMSAAVGSPAGHDNDSKRAKTKKEDKAGAR
jgi:hypothetical protein